MTDAFDGDAVSRADREFLDSLNNHPLIRHPLYSVPPPPRPDYAGCTIAAERTARQRACFPAALDWMLINYAYYADAFMGKGGIISLVDGKIGTVAGMRGLMQPYAVVEEGPYGGLHKTSVVDAWMSHPLRAHVDKIQTRFDRLRPTFEEEGVIVYNRYWPSVHPASGGELKSFDAFFARLIPNDTEREWMWNYLAHKARRPWVPMIAVIMVAEEFGTGRGTLFDILELLFGEDYVVPCTFGELTGTATGARFNDRLANALIATVNEAADEDGYQQARRRLDYEALKNAIEPSPTARHRFVVKLPAEDRRFSVVTCGSKMTPSERTDIRTWMAVPENIGALYRALLMRPAVPLDMFDPYGDPPPFAGRLAMIGMGETRLEDAYRTAIDALDGCPLFTMTQMQRLIAYFGDFRTGDWSDKARHTVAKNAYRLRERSEPNNRITYRKRQEIVYASTNANQRRWYEVDTGLIIRQLDIAEDRMVQVINANRDVFADLMRAHDPNSPPKA
jgi:hypothetical protein